MTSAPVRDAGSLMNYVGVGKTAAGIGANSAENFGDVMKRTGGSQENLSGRKGLTFGNDKNLTDVKAKASLNSKEASETEKPPKPKRLPRQQKGK